MTSSNSGRSYRVGIADAPAGVHYDTTTRRACAVTPAESGFSGRAATPPPDENDGEESAVDDGEEGVDGDGVGEEAQGGGNAHDDGDPSNGTSADEGEPPTNAAGASGTPMPTTASDPAPASAPPDQVDADAAVFDVPAIAPNEAPSTTQSRLRSHMAEHGFTSADLEKNGRAFHVIMEALPHRGVSSNYRQGIPAWPRSNGHMNVVERVIIPKEIDGVLEFGAKWPLQKLPLRCADGDFTCVHGESHNVLRAITLKGQVCSCKPISVVQENNVLLSDDFEYGLCEGAHAGFGRSAHAHLALKPRVCRPRARSRAGGLRTLPRLARAARKVVGS